MKTKIRKQFLKEKHNEGAKTLGKKRLPDFSQKNPKQGRILIGKTGKQGGIFVEEGIRAGRPAKMP